MRPSARWRGPAVASVLLAALIPAGVVAGAAAPTCAAVQQGADGWSRVVRPAGLEDVKVVAVSPQDSRRLWVSDGFQVARSGDGGCTWRVVTQVTTFVTINAQDPDSYITQVLVAGAPGSETVWVVEQSGSLVGEPRTVTVSVARDGTDDFVESAGLPRVGGVRLAVGPSPQRAYAVTRPVDVGLGVTAEPPGVHTTSDAGRTWTGGARLPSGFVDRGADVGPDGALVTWSDEAVLRSATGAAAAPLPVPEGGVATVSSGRSLVVLPGGGTALVSGDGGRSFAGRTVPAGAAVAADLPGTTLLGLAGGGGVALWDARAGVSVDASPTGLEVTSLAAAGGRTPALVGRAGPVLALLPLTARGVPLRPRKAPVPGKVALVPPQRVVPADPVLRPAATTLVLRPGETRRVPYQLALPPTPGRLDVVFLIDTTGSMQPAIDGLRASVQRIVDGLASTGSDAWFGLADFRDIDSADLAGGSVYRLGQRLAPAGDGLRRALEQLDIGGGGDAPEADTIALTQAVTGAGQTGLVPPGRQAGFRQGSTRVVVLITDAPFHVEPPVYPTHAEVLATLTAANVKVLGVSIGDGGLEDLERVASGTGTRTPEEGIDCDGDGDSDVAAGAPAVCRLDERARGAARLGEPITALLQAVAQPGRVTVTAQGGAVRQVSGPVDQVLDLARRQQVSFAVDYACGAGDAGRMLTAALTAEVDGRSLASAGADVRCTGVPVPPRPPVAEVEPAEPASVVLPAAPAPPPAQVPQAQPVTNPQAAPQPGAVTNPQVLALTAEQEQAQLQLALAAQELESSEELAMTARPRHEEEAAARLLLATSLALAAGAGLLHRRRERPVVARAAAAYRS